VKRTTTLFWSLVLLVTLACAAGAAELAGDIQLNIRFYDKKVYYTAASGGIPANQDEPIYVVATVYNGSPVPFRFKLAEERVFSVDFDVRSLANQSRAPANYLLKKRGESRNVYFREITVEPRESYSFIEDIRNYADLSEAGSFVVQARLFPELFRTAGTLPLESNRLNLNLRPPLLKGPEGIPYEMDVETGAVLARESLPPDEVIRYMLDARIKGQWERFFLYMDIPALIGRDESRWRAYLNESEEGRQRMIVRYREDLQSAVVDGDIAVIPTDYRIESTTYNNDIGTVVVTEWFTTGRVTERRRYTYGLRRVDDIWLIQDYTPTKLGNE
jgi:hypothetical protein